MENPDELSDFSREELEEEIRKLRSTIERRDEATQKAVKTGGKGMLWFFAGPRLYSATNKAWESWINWLEEGRQKDEKWPEKETGKLVSSFVARFYRLGFISLLIALLPILVLAFQSFIMLQQSKGLEAQNQIIRAQSNLNAYSQLQDIRERLVQTLETDTLLIRRDSTIFIDYELQEFDEIFEDAEKIMITHPDVVKSFFNDMLINRIDLAYLSYNFLLEVGHADIPIVTRDISGLTIPYIEIGSNHVKFYSTTDYDTVIGSVYWSDGFEGITTSISALRSEIVVWDLEINVDSAKVSLDILPQDEVPDWADVASITPYGFVELSYLSTLIHRVCSNTYIIGSVRLFSNNRTIPDFNDLVYEACPERFGRFEVNEDEMRVKYLGPLLSDTSTAYSQTPSSLD